MMIQGIITGSLFFTFALIIVTQNIWAQIESPIQNASAQILDNNSSTVQKTNLTSDFLKNVSSGNTYVNPENGILLNYPKNWKTAIDSADANLLVSFYSPLQNLSDSSRSRLSISIINYVQNISLNEFTNTTLKTVNDSGRFQLLNKSVTTLAGLPANALFMASKSLPDTNATLYIFETWAALQNKIIFVSYVSSPEDFKSHGGELNQMLRSMRIAQK
jgi:hypothetical protein